LAAAVCLVAVFDVVDHAVGKVLLLRVVAEILKWQDDD
jgi:hypothetical protein